jgi:hypothetical protein
MLAFAKIYALLALILYKVNNIDKRYCRQGTRELKSNEESIHRESKSSAEAYQMLCRGWLDAGVCGGWLNAGCYAKAGRRSRNGRTFAHNLLSPHLGPHYVYRVRR